MSADVATLPGVGPELAGRIRQRFGSDAGFYQAAAKLDVASIARVEGVGPKRARRLIRVAQGTADPSTFLQTDPALRIWDNIIADVQSYAGTPEARERIGLQGPQRDAAAADASIANIMAWKMQVKDWDRDAVRNALRAVRPLTEPSATRSAERIVIAEPDEHERLEKLGIDRWIALETPDAMGDGYELVLMVGEMDVLDSPNLLPLARGAGLAEIAPHAILRWFAQAMPTLKALRAIATATGTPDPAGDALSLLAADSNLPPLPDVATIVAAESKRLEQEAHTLLAEVQLTGAELLTSRSDGLPDRLAAMVQKAIAESHKRLAEQLGCRVDIFRPGRPVRMDDEAVSELAQRIRAAEAVRDHQTKSALARQLGKLQPKIAGQLDEVLEWEANFAWGSYALAHNLEPVTWGSQLKFHEGHHLGLGDAAQPVDYELGGDAPVALLTGANSGGKTTLLEMLVQIVAMSHFGVPVPASEAQVPWCDDLHLLTHRRSMGAGAFEAFLRRFMPLAEKGGRRLVLADEIEAITELQAATRIVGYFLQKLRTNGHLGLFVTHMAPLLREHAPGVRIDGIQSTGLDEDGELIVDRAPRLGVMASSTPELILERIARREKGGPWGELLELLRTPSAVEATLATP